MTATAIGAMRERVTVQAATETADLEGQPVKIWTTFAKTWARIEFLSGRELEGMQKINAQISVRLTMRWNSAITENMRVLWRNLNWNIHAILPTEDKFDMALLASKVE